MILAMCDASYIMRDSSIHPYTTTDYKSDDYLQINVFYFSLSFFCIIISLCLSLSIIAVIIEKLPHYNIDEYEGCELDQLRHLRSNPKKVSGPLTYQFITHQIRN